jgi:hypothetical protein
MPRTGAPLLARYGKRTCNKHKSETPLIYCCRVIVASDGRRRRDVENHLCNNAPASLPPGFRGQSHSWKPAHQVRKARQTCSDPTEDPSCGVRVLLGGVLVHQLQATSQQESYR